MAITISDVTPRVQYTATSGQTAFSINFEFFVNADIKVYNGSTLLAYEASPSDATKYSVTGAGVTGGGSITLGSPGATVNDVITIYRDMSIARATDFPTSGAFQIASLNDELDKIIAMTQQVSRDLKYSPRAASTTASTYNLTFPELAANKILTVNSGGTALEFSHSITNVNTIAGIASDVTTVSGIASNVTSVASNASNINLVAGSIGSVNAVAADITKVVAVANDLAEAVSEVETVADDLNEATSEIDTVATSITNVDAVGTNIANVNTVAGISSAVTAVNNNSSNINAVNSNSTNINTVAGANSNITTLAGIDANITTVAGISANVTTVAGDTTNIGTVAGAIANVNLVGGSIANVNLTGGSIANVNTVATNLAAVNSFANTYRISSSAPSSSLDIGDLYFDTTANELKVYKSSGWAAAGSTVNGTSQRYEYTATANQTTFTGADINGNTLAYDAGFADVYLNGVRLNGADITITSGTSVVLATGAAVGDNLSIVGYGTFNVAAVNGSAINAGTINEARLPASALGAVWESKSANFTAEARKNYFIDTSSNAVDVTLPSGTIGDTIRFLDVSGTFDTNDLTILNGSSKIQGASANLDVATERAGFGLVYYNSTQGWLLIEK